MDRRRAAIAMSPAVEDDDRARKRRKQSDESVSPQTVFDTVWNHKERNRNIRQHFEELPSKDVYPDYYVKITDPISLNEIQKKLDDEEYAGVADIQKDLIRMVENATIYNKAKSQVHSDALRLRSVVESFNVGGADEPNGKIKRETEVVGRTPRGSRAGPPPIRDAQVQIIDDLLALTDANGEIVSYHFKTLPARKSYPDYYKVIQQPISLNQIRSRAKDGSYRTWAEFEEAVYLIKKNAELYNDEASEIVKDARALEAHFTHILQKQKAKNGDAPSGLKLRFNIGGRTAAHPATPASKTPAAKTPAPKIKLHMKKEIAPQTPTMAPAARTNGVPKTVPPKPPVDRRSPPKAQPALIPAPTPAPMAAPVIAPVPVPVAQKSPTKLLPNHVVKQQAPVMKRSDSVTSPTPMTGIIMNGAGVTPNDTIVVSKTPSLTPQPAINNVMPPPVQRLSTTPRPSYSPIPSIASPAPPPVQQIPYARPLYQYDEPRFRPEGKDASSALISSLCISSTSALNSSEQYTKTLHPDDQKVTSQFYLHLPAEYHTIKATPTLSAELMGKLYRLSIDVKFNNSPPKSIPMIDSSASKKNAEPQFEAIRLVPGVVNTLECTVVTEARRPDGTMAGWELERYRVFIMLLP